MLHAILILNPPHVLDIFSVFFNYIVNIETIDIEIMHETNCWIYRVRKPTYCLYSKVISLIIKAYIKSHKKRNY